MMNALSKAILGAAAWALTAGSCACGRGLQSGGWLLAR